MEEQTTITISQELWKLINEDRINSKETMEDVIWRWKNLLAEKKGTPSCEDMDRDSMIKKEVDSND